MVIGRGASACWCCDRQWLWPFQSTCSFRAQFWRILSDGSSFTKRLFHFPTLWQAGDTGGRRLHCTARWWYLVIWWSSYVYILSLIPKQKQSNQRQSPVIRQQHLQLGSTNNGTSETQSRILFSFLDNCCFLVCLSCCPHSSIFHSSLMLPFIQTVYLTFLFLFVSCCFVASSVCLFCFF